MAWADSKNPRNYRLPGDWKTRRAKVLRRDHRTCQINGRRCTYDATEVDHIVRGDDHSLGNLQSACRNCHREKTSKEAGEASGRANTARAQARFRPKERHPSEFITVRDPQVSREHG